jgi:hypothetical protein
MGVLITLLILYIYLNKPLNINQIFKLWLFLGVVLLLSLFVFSLNLIIDRIKFSTNLIYIYLIMLCEVSIIIQNLLANCYEETSAVMICNQACSHYINDVSNTCLQYIISTPNFEGLWEAFTKLCEGH